MAVVVVLLALLAAACGGGDEDVGGVAIGTVEATASASATATAVATRTVTAVATPSATASATATATRAASPCPAAPDACSFMSQVAQNVLEGDSAAVLSLSKATAYTCPGPNGDEGGPFPLCNGARTGEIRLGFPLVRMGTESGVVPESAVVPLLAGWAARTEPSLRDEYGDGAARAVSLACRGVGPYDPPSCLGRFSLVFSGLSPGASAGQALRTMLAVVVEPDGNTYRAISFVTGVLESGLPLALRGGSASAGEAAEAGTLVGGSGDWSVVTFFPWAPIGLGR